MNYDLRTILDGWEYEAGKISVRKIVGREGREKIQTRIDLGLLQFELDGRPDGKRPMGCDSLLDFWERKLQEHLVETGDEEGFSLTPDDCRDLRQEGHLYYQRYLSMFVLEEFAGVERDTARNLRLIDFCRDYAESPDDQAALESHRPYVVMMHTRARTYLALSHDEPESALLLLEDGLKELHAAIESVREEGLEADPSLGQQELKVLHALREEIYQKLPADATPRLKRELEDAVAREDYERAAKLRDRLQQSGAAHPAPARPSAPAAATRSTPRAG
jgi:hypothetical protein